MKKNLAKVLGMEQFQEDVAPVKIQEDPLSRFNKDVSEHLHAADVALESIGSANALGNVISTSNSADPATYAVLRTAVEQLKERTGVKTQSAALEDLSPLSYKAEAIEEIKKFVTKIWEAIKKAFFVMVEKTKAFFKKMFDAGERVEKAADAVEEEHKAFVKEVDKAPKSEQQAQNYSSDYFGIKPGDITNKEPRGDEPNVTVTDHEYSSKVINVLGFGNDPDKWSSDIFQVYGKWTEDIRHAATNFENYLMDTFDNNKLMDIGLFVGTNHTRITEIDQKDSIIPKQTRNVGSSIFAIKTKMGGNTTITCSRIDDEITIDVSSLGDITESSAIGMIGYEELPPLITKARSVRFQTNRILKKLGEAIDVEQRNFAAVNKAFDSTHQFSISGDEMQKIRDSYYNYIQLMASASRAAATLNKYANTLLDAVTTYCKVTVEMYKRTIQKNVNSENYNFDKLMDNYRKTGYKITKASKWHKE